MKFTPAAPCGPVPAEGGCRVVDCGQGQNFDHRGRDLYRTHATVVHGPHPAAGMLTGMTDAPSTDTEALQQNTPTVTAPKGSSRGCPWFRGARGRFGQGRAAADRCGRSTGDPGRESGGVLGDRVVNDLATAKAVIDVVDGLEEAPEWDREPISTVTPQKGHYAKMAGWSPTRSASPGPATPRSSIPPTATPAWLTDPGCARWGRQLSPDSGA